MKKLLILILVISASAFALSSLTTLTSLITPTKNPPPTTQPSKKPLLRVALAADPHNENDLLEKALKQASGAGVNFVIGLGDYTAVGTQEELKAAKTVFENAKLPYYTTAGDHDLWDSRNKGEDPLANYSQIFGQSTQVFERENVLFVILDNSDIYSGISQEDWEILSSNLSNLSDLSQPRLKFIFAHKTPFHPQSSHVMGEGSAKVAKQAERLLGLMESTHIDGFFSGDIHFFAQFSTAGNSQAESVKITTVGAVAKERNFQGPRFGILTIYSDYSWKVEDVEIRF